jgi:surfactin synthase thioesterase subunit
LSSPRLASKFARMMGALHPQARLFCFPFAGGSSPVFVGWGEALKPEVEVWSAQPRGRGVRFRETLYATVEEMVEDFLPLLREHAEMPFAFYGHSLGGLVAFELTRRLQAEGAAGPEHLFLGASIPPHLGLIHPRIDHLPDEQFVGVIQERYAGIPDVVLQEPELMEMFLPVLRTDFGAYERYEFADSGQIRCPLTAFVGQDDPAISQPVMTQWGLHTEGPFALHVVPGGHFFLTESRDAVLAEIRESLKAVLSPTISSSAGATSAAARVRPA